MKGKQNPMPEKRPLRQLDRVLAEILHERAALRISERRHFNALPMLRTLVMEFPDDQKARTALIDVCRELARQAEKKGNHDQARTYLAEASQLVSETSADTEPPEEKRGEGDDLLGLARRFIDRHYPDQSRWLDMAWRIFHNVEPESFIRTIPSGALGAVGETEEGRVATQVAILLGVLERARNSALDQTAAEEKMRKAGDRIGADDVLINRLLDLIRQ